MTQIFPHSPESSPFPRTPISDLFGIQHPIIQAGMVWVSGGKLAAAAANAGCLGLIGAGSMKPEILKAHIRKARSLTALPFGVNVPLLYEKAEEQIRTALDEGVRIFFTSAGSPRKMTPLLKREGCQVVHVVSTVEFAKKSEDAGVDAVVVEGFEAGGHNGREELTTLVLLQQIRNKLSIPVIAAGGIGSGAAIAAALILGAAAVQIGTVFAATEESSAHPAFKQAMRDAPHNATNLYLKKLVPVRLMHNEFSRRVTEAEERCADREELAALLGKGRAHEGMFQGNLQEGELEAGQIVSEVSEILSCNRLVEKLVSEFIEAKKRIL